MEHGVWNGLNWKRGNCEEKLPAAVVQLRRNRGKCGHNNKKLRRNKPW